MIEQGSPEWRQQRCGKLTASRFADVLSVLKSGKPSEARKKYMREVAFEILSGVPRHEVQGASLSWGKDIETYAREAYELYTGNIVTTAEFSIHPEFNFIGSSPDGLVDVDGGVEIKCPHDEGKHIQTLLDGMPEEHISQVQGNLFVTGRAWWDFVSYDPRQAEGYRLHVQRINRDEEFIKRLSESLAQFWTEVNEMVDQLKSKRRAV